MRVSRTVLGEHCGAVPLCYSTLNVRHDQILVIIDHLRAQYCQADLLTAFEMARSTYQYRCQKAKRVDHNKERLKQKVEQIHSDSRGVAGS